MLTDAQKALRRTGVGASECAAALGLSPYQTRFELYQVKRGEAPEAPDNLAMRFGLAAEPFILSEFQRAHSDDLLVVAPDTMRRGRMFAHLDAWVPGSFNVQAKTARTRHGWGESGSPDIPQHYLLQVQQEMLLASVDVSFVPVLFGGADYDEFVIEADRELQELIEDGIAEFWRLVERGEPPEPVSLDDMLARFGSTCRAGQARADTDVLRAVHELGWTDSLCKKVRLWLRPVAFELFRVITYFSAQTELAPKHQPWSEPADDRWRPPLSPSRVGTPLPAPRQRCPHLPIASLDATACRGG